MRNFITKALIASSIVFCLGSCTDYLDKEPDDYLNLEKVFNDKSDVESWLSAVYSGIVENYASAMRGFDSMADDIAPSLGWEAYGWPVIGYQKGNFDPTTDWEYRGSYWYTLPRRTRSAYTLLERIHSLPEQGLTDQEVEYMKNEAKFLIAYNNYSRLIVWGAIPVQQGMANLKSDTLMIGQTPFDDVVNDTEAKLLEAARGLPPSYTDAKKYGRATSIMCYAIRARLLLFAASPLVNGNNDYANYRNNKGQLIFNPVYDPAKWTRAAKACKELIDLAAANGHELYKEYNSDGTIDPYMSFQNMLFVTANRGNNEILFPRAWVNSDSYDRHAQPRGTAGNGGLGVSQTLVDAFYMKNGLAPITGYNADGSPVINTASGYTETGFSSSDDVAKTKWIEGGPNGSTKNTTNVITQAGTFNMYCNREPRFYITVLYNGAWSRREGRNTQFYSGGYDGGPTHDAPSYGYLVRKKVSPDVDPRQNVAPYRPGVLYRMGDAYLDYAEALNESDPGNPDIVKYLNLIRERAGIPQYGTSAGLIPVPANQEEMREAIHHERRVELACENGTRWFDLRRWKEAEKQLSGIFYGMNFSGTLNSDNKSNPKSYFVRTPVMTRSFTKKNYWMPIPQDEIDKNPNLHQLPGWN